MGCSQPRAYGFTKQEALNSLEAQLVKTWNLRFCRDKENRLFVRRDLEDKEYVYVEEIRVELQDPGKVYKAYLLE